MSRSSILAALITVMFACPSALLAEGDSGDDVVCAAVVPCGQDGVVLAPFNQGPCAPRYALQCASKRMNETSDALMDCESTGESMQSQLRSMEKELKRVRKQHRLLLRRARR